MKKKMLFIYNALSGKGAITNALSDILTIFTEGGYDVIVHPTTAPGDGLETAKRFADKVDLIAVAGGDGTLDEVVTGIMSEKSQVPVGYIPSGSTNDFAASLDIPKSLTEAAHHIIDGEVYPCDIGTFNDTYFVYVAAFGLLTQVSYETDQGLKNTFGRLAYLLEAGKQIFNVPTYHIRLTADNRIFEGNYIYGMISNTRSVGGFKGITGNAVDMSDGLFEVTLIRMPTNPLDLSEILTTLLSGDGHSALVETVKARKILVEPQEAIDWTLDGEYGDSHQEVLIENKHHAMKIILKREKKSP